jgi:hypothetical protein
MQALVSVQSRARASRVNRSRQAAHPVSGIIFTNAGWLGRDPWSNGFLQFVALRLQGATTPEKYEQGAYDGTPRHGRSGSLKVFCVSRFHSGLDFHRHDSRR